MKKEKLKKMCVKISTIISSLFLVSCLAGLEEDILGKSYPGFHLVAYTSQEGEGEFEGELFIGGINDSVFIPTESIPFHFDGGINKTTVAFHYDENKSKVTYFEENSWKPNLEVIKKKIHQISIVFY